MKEVCVLHVSDVHFGKSDPKNEQPRIAEALITAAHDYARKSGTSPHLCVFSGDLTQHGKPGELKAGEMWLNRLVEPWPDCQLCLVPGNHEVKRPRTGTKTLLRLKREVRGASQTLEKYNSWQDDVRKGKLMRDFMAWHSQAKTHNSLRLVSDWSDPCAFITTMTIEGLTIKVIGLNTALLSIDDDDEGELAIDISKLNGLLIKTNPLTELVIVAGHHPVGLQITEQAGENPKLQRWLASWNDAEVEKLLLQATGPHIYLHGHMHKATAWATSYNTGQNIIVLGAGAAYQGSDWPQHFAFYRINAPMQEIKSETFRYSNNGEWLRDTERSQAFRCALPGSFLRGAVEECRVVCEEHRKLAKAYNNFCTEIDRIVDLMYSERSQRRYSISKIEFECIVQRTGDAEIKQTLTVQALEKPLHFIRLWISSESIRDHGELVAGTMLEDFELDVNDRSDNGYDIAFVPAKRDENKRYVAVFFLPEMAPNTFRKVEMVMKWPRLLSELASRKAQPFYWEWPNAEVDAVIEFRGQWDDITCQDLSGVGAIEKREARYGTARWCYNAKSGQDAKYEYEGEKKQGHALLFAIPPDEQTM